MAIGPWNEKEDQFLTENYRTLSFEEIAEKLHRTRKETVHRSALLKLSRKFVDRTPILKGVTYLIPLYNKKNRDIIYSVIDREDLEKVLGHNWFSSLNYVTAHTNPGTIRMHRLILPPPENYVIDHINFNTLDNRKENLRIATKSQSTAHRRKFRGVDLPYKGVNLCSSKNGRVCWEANVGEKYIGRFNTIIEAAQAYDREAKKMYGEFAVLNFPEIIP